MIGMSLRGAERFRVLTGAAMLPEDDDDEGAAGAAEDATRAGGIMAHWMTHLSEELT